MVYDDQRFWEVLIKTDTRVLVL